MQTLFQLTQKEYDALCKKHFPFADYENKLSECFEMITKLQQEIDGIKAQLEKRENAPAVETKAKPVKRSQSRNQSAAPGQDVTQPETAPEAGPDENDFETNIEDGGAVITKYTGSRGNGYRGRRLQKSAQSSDHSPSRRSERDRQKCFQRLHGTQHCQNS